MKIQLKMPAAKRVSDGLLLFVLLLISLSLAGQASKYLLGHPRLKGFVPAFYVDYEPTVPTWYSSAALGCAGVLLALIALAKYKTRDRFRFHWATLSGLLFLLSCDEVAMFHELPIDPLREALQADGLLYYTWVIPGSLLVGIVGCLYLRFFLCLPGQTKCLFLLAVVIFLAGSIGVALNRIRGSRPLSWSGLSTDMCSDRARTASRARVAASSVVISHCCHQLCSRSDILAP